MMAIRKELQELDEGEIRRVTCYAIGIAGKKDRK